MLRYRQQALNEAIFSCPSRASSIGALLLSKASLMFSKFFSWFRFSYSTVESTPTSLPKPLPSRKAAGPGMFQKMRDLQLRTPPAEMGLTPASPDQLVGVCMEQLVGAAVMSLRCFLDGTVSVYFSAGGAIIGIGQHDEGREAGRRLLEEAQGLSSQFLPDSELALPGEGQTRFVLVRFDGTYAASEATALLESGNGALAGLYRLGQEVLAVARRLHESRVQGS